MFFVLLLYEWRKVRISLNCLLFYPPLGYFSYTSYPRETTGVNIFVQWGAYTAVETWKSNLSYSIIITTLIVPCVLVGKSLLILGLWDSSKQRSFPLWECCTIDIWKTFYLLSLFTPKQIFWLELCFKLQCLESPRWPWPKSSTCIH